MFHYLTTRNNDLYGFRRELDRVFDDFWSMPASDSGAQSPRSWAPAAEIQEGSDHYLLSLEVPGMKKEELKIEVAHDHLVIAGERRVEESREGKGSLYSERRFGQFERSFALPTNADPAKIEAQYADGILKVYVPKSATATPRQIKIGDSASGGIFSRLLGKREEERKTLDSGTSGRVA